MTTTETTALVRQMREALAARRAFDTEPGCAINRKLYGDMDRAIAAADQWLAQPPTNQCGETCERARLCAVCARGLDEQQRRPLTDEQISEVEDWFSNEFGLEAKHSADFARAIETACAAALGVKLDGAPLPMEHYRAVCAGAVRPTQPGATPGALRCALIHSA